MSDNDSNTVWCKILKSPKYGDVLVTRSYDDEDGNGDEKVNMEFRSRYAMVLTWSFFYESEAQAAFDGLNDSNIDDVRGVK